MIHTIQVLRPIVPSQLRLFRGLNEHHISSIANNYLTPIALAGVTASAISKLIGSNGSGASTGKDLKQMLDPNIWNGVGDLIAALGDVSSRPAAALANLLRTGLNFCMSSTDSNVQVIANELFAIPTWLMTGSSWSISEHALKSPQRTGIKGIPQKFNFEIAHLMNSGRKLIDPKSYFKFAREVQSSYRSAGVRGAANAFSIRLPYVLGMTSLLSLSSGVALLMGNLFHKGMLPHRAGNKHMGDESFNWLESAGWGAMKGALSVLTASYLLKTINRNYLRRNGLFAVILSGLTFTSMLIRIPVASDPNASQLTRLFSDSFMRLEGLLLRISDAKRAKG